MAKIKVLIIDDSALIRKLLTEILSSDREIEVVGTAADPYIAREKIKQLHPNVLTLDVEMPKMDGITFLGNLMRLHPLPVVMVSSLTQQGANVSLRALELGAVDIVSKPKLDVAAGMEEYAEEIREKVKIAAQAKVMRHGRPLASQLDDVAPKLTADVVLSKKNLTKTFSTTNKLIAIGASTGGTEAIREVLSTMPADAPGIVITQHIPEEFSLPFAKRMNNCSAMTVCEASDGQQILPGHAYIAPGSRHLLVHADGARFVCRLSDGPRVNRHKPSVDVMFRSVAQNIGPNAVGVILTGMGDDGARGMREMFDSGATTIAQDEKTCVVWGMPKEAVIHGGVSVELPLGKITQKTLQFVNENLGNKQSSSLP